MKKVIISLISMILVLSFASCNQTVPSLSDKIGDGEKVYIYENEGFGGIFTITLFADGTFSYYEGMLSSHVGMGTWEQNGNILTLIEGNASDSDSYKRQNCFQIDGDDLVFLSQDSHNFIYVDVKEGDKFSSRIETTAAE